MNIQELKEEKGVDKRHFNRGRPKGVKNKASRSFKAWASALLESREYQESARARLLKGTAPQLEKFMLEWTYGRPAQAVDVTSRGKRVFNFGLPEVDFNHVGEKARVGAKFGFEVGDD